MPRSFGYIMILIGARDERKLWAKFEFQLQSKFSHISYDEWLGRHGGVLVIDKNCNSMSIKFEDDNDALLFKLKYM